MSILDHFRRPAPVDADQAAQLISIIAKGQTPSKYQPPFIRDETDVLEDHQLRRAISSISNYWNTLGVYRSDFNKGLNDDLAQNVYYQICEKAMMDYFGCVEWTVTDDNGKEVPEAVDFLMEPNPQEDLGQILKATLKDLIRYDAGVIVKTYSRDGYVKEIKSYLGTEFWKEIDRVPFDVKVPQSGQYYTSYWSNNYVVRYWQRSRTGLYISFVPDEISYFMMYPHSDGIYGTDYLKFLKYQILYLIDSTIAAGKTFENGVVPSVVWEHPVIQTRDQLLQRIKEVETDNIGSYNFGGIMHTINGEKVDTLASTLHDMEWLEGQRFVGSLIWAMWGFSATEFLEDSGNRATAYVKRNITKSRMLQPLMTYIETRINRDILPHIKGYKKTWKFAFVRDIDLDDMLKSANIQAVRSTTFVTLVGAGVPPALAAQISQIGDDLSTPAIEELGNMPTMWDMQGAQDTEDQSGAPEAGRYNGGSGDYVQFNPGDGMQGQDMATGNTRDEELQKGKVYISDPKQAPAGAPLQRGSRGGFYYDSSFAARSKGNDDKPSSKKRPLGHKPDPRKKPRGGSGKPPRDTKPIKTHPPRQLLNSDRWVHLSGGAVDFFVGKKGAEVKYVVKNNPQSKKAATTFASHLNGKTNILDVGKVVSQEYGLSIESGR